MALLLIYYRSSNPDPDPERLKLVFKKQVLNKYRVEKKICTVLNTV